MGDTTSIIAACIAAVVSLGLFVANVIVNKYFSGKPTTAEIYKRQLFEVFEPIILLFESEEKVSNTQLINQIGAIIYSHYSLVPPVLLSEYKALKAHEQVSNNNIQRLKDIATSHYNLVKKKLSYPYDNDVIIKKWTVKAEPDSNKLFRVVQWVILWIMTAILAFQLINAQIQLSQRQSELAALSSQVDEISAENDDLQERMNNIEMK